MAPTEPIDPVFSNDLHSWSINYCCLFVHKRHQNFIIPSTYRPFFFALHFHFSPKKWKSNNFQTIFISLYLNNLRKYSGLFYAHLWQSQPITEDLWQVTELEISKWLKNWMKTRDRSRPRTSPPFYMLANAMSGGWTSWGFYPRPSNSEGPPVGVKRTSWHGFRQDIQKNQIIVPGDRVMRGRNPSTGRGAVEMTAPWGCFWLSALGHKAINPRFVRRTDLHKTGNKELNTCNIMRSYNTTQTRSKVVLHLGIVWPLFRTDATTPFMYYWGWISISTKM